MSLLTASEVAERLSVPESWVRKQVQKNAIPYVKLGTYVRFVPDDVDRYVKEQTR